MPIEFDPAWEYRVDNPDFTDDTKIDPVVALIHDKYDNRLGITGGIRFGNGNPDGPTYQADYGFITDASLDYQICETCGGRFLPDRSSRKYCSLKCRKIPGAVRQWPDRLCAGCGEPFRPLQRHTRFCSRRCLLQTRAKEKEDRLKVIMALNEQRVPRKTGRKRTLTDRECKQCGKVFYPKALTQSHCSKQCANKSSIEFQLAKWSRPRVPKLPKPEKELPPKYCLICRKCIIVKSRNHYTVMKYCSSQCGGIACDRRYWAKKRGLTTNKET